MWTCHLITQNQSSAIDHFQIWLPGVHESEARADCNKTVRLIDWSTELKHFQNDYQQETMVTVSCYQKLKQEA